MSFKFNYQPPRKRIKSDVLCAEDGSPLYSSKRTAGTVRADAVLGVTLSPDKTRIVRVAPMPTPPKRFNGPLNCRGAR